MGGTSFDLSLIVDGRPTVSTETELEGLPILMPLVDIHTIGAGGGSLAWLEAGGLRVGPQSAGADPGPACYGRGGTEPTVTDANLFLGRLDPATSSAGAWRSTRRRPRGAARRSPARSGSTTRRFAEGMLAIVNANMADAMRTITVKQGIDPRDFALVAFGGAGPMHAVWLAEELEIARGDRALEPGHVLGLGNAADRHPPRRRAELLPAARRASSADAVAEAARRARGARAAELLAHEGIAAGDRYFARSADMRYVGQEYTVNVPIGGDGAICRRSTRRSTTPTACATGTPRRARRSSSSTCASPAFGRIARRCRSLPATATSRRPGRGRAPRDVRRATAHDTPCCTATGLRAGRGVRGAGW